MSYCCAIEACDKPSCPVCSVNERFPPVVGCKRLGTIKPCKFVAGHRDECQVKR
jgi:hypothetical protein